MKKAQRHKKYKEGGKKGGDKTLEMHGKKHYKKIGKDGAIKRWSKPLVEDEGVPDEFGTFENGVV